MAFSISRLLELFKKQKEEQTSSEILQSFPQEKLKALGIRLFRIKLPEDSSKTVEVIKGILPELVADIKSWIETQE